MKKIRTHYDNLKVARDAPQEVIRSAFKALSMKYHPDRNDNSIESQKVMRIINESYDVLSDVEKRSKHDAWISSIESNTGETVKPPPQGETARDTATFMPKKGSAVYNDLNSKLKALLKARVSGQKEDQYAIKLRGMTRNVIWTGLFLCWFPIMFVFTDGYEWSQNTREFYIWTTIVCTLFIAINIASACNYYRSPLKCWLIVTPLYIIRTRFDRIWYWPIHTIRDFNATHRYTNGSYQGTDVSIFFDGIREEFTFPQKKPFDRFMKELEANRQAIYSALKNRNYACFSTANDFKNVRDSKRPKKINFNPVSLLIFAATAASAAAVFLIASTINSELPSQPRFARMTTPAQTSSSPSYIYPSMAPNGSEWPTLSGYVGGYPIGNSNGYSNLTIDNTRNSSDVFVKLTELGYSELSPVSQFFVSSGSRFRLENISPGRYDIRYRDLEMGNLSRSEPFTLEENESFDGVQFSEMTMTLYRVTSGNMQTYRIGENEF